MSEADSVATRLASGLTLYRLDPEPEVLLVTSNWPHADEPAHPDGARYGIFVRRQVESLRRQGIGFDVLFVRGFAGSRAYVRAAALLAKWSASKQPRYRLVHAHGGESAFPAVFYRRAPLLLSYCGDDLLGTPDETGTVPFRGRLRRALVRQPARVATWTITKSSEMECYLPPRARKRNSVVPNGVDRRVFRELDREEARARLGWSASERVVLFAADPAVVRKRHALAVSASQRAARQIPGLRLHVADRVPPDDMPVLMSAADCLLLTSAVEGSPNVVKEAVMCNLPVVTTAVGDVREVLEQVEPSFVCDADPDDLARAIVTCVRTPRRSNGRAVSARLDASAVAESLATIYRTVMERSGPPAVSAIFVERA
jgi:teichuronic acid biosynthesis glycosyltransferase TuaC